jgi:hypothetical protein
MFALFYGLFRFIVEFYRVPDAHLGYLAMDWLTMGKTELGLPKRLRKVARGVWLKALRLEIQMTNIHRLVYPIILRCFMDSSVLS